MVEQMKIMKYRFSSDDDLPLSKSSNLQRGESY